MSPRSAGRRILLAAACAAAAAGLRAAPAPSSNGLNGVTAAQVGVAGSTARGPDLALSTSESNAEPLAVDRGAAGVWQALRRLQTRASLLQVTAHPDDEDGGMLTRESRGRGTRVELLCLTRGEGGANIMSNDYFDALGLVRTQELLAASRYYGVRPWFGTVVDYGFSKTREECLGQWTRERALGDVVRIIRRTRPLVLTSVFNGTASDGHGNHQVAGQVTTEAFRAAGDPTMFPEQIASEGLRPWAPLKLYVRVPRGPATAANVTIAAGEYDPALGLSFAQLARAGLGEHKSQNGGTGASPPSASKSGYRRVASLAAAADTESSFFDGIDTSLAAIATLADPRDRSALATALGRVELAVRDAITAFSVEHPERAATPLARGLAATREALGPAVQAENAGGRRGDAAYELRVKEEQFQQALVLALGISATAVLVPDEPVQAGARGFAPTAAAIGIPGRDGAPRVRIRVDVANGSGASVQLESVEITRPRGQQPGSSPTVPPLDLVPGHVVTRTFDVQLSTNARVTRPYFTRPSIEQPYYDLDDVAHAGWPSAADLPSATIAFSYDGVHFGTSRVTQAATRATGLGTVLHPVALVPAVSLAIAPRAGVVPLTAGSFEVTATVATSREDVAGRVRLELPAGWTATPPSAPFTGGSVGQAVAIPFIVKPAVLAPRTYTVTAVADASGREYKEGYRTAGYAGLPPSYLYAPSTLRVSGVDLQVAPGLAVGYVEGSGDEVAACLGQLGIRTQPLTGNDLESGDLRRFDAIVLGVRAYAVRDDLKANNRRLLEYVRNGGIVIVQYNTPEFDHDYGPYPYKMGNEPEEVTDERSRVDILEPAHALLAWPNVITVRDFDDWVEERGSKFLASWDPRYTALLATSDAGQAPQKGGLLFARYGKGAWVYNAYAFYRQLPEGVPGAFRIFANMVSLGKNPRLGP